MDLETDVATEPVVAGSDATAAQTADDNNQEAPVSMSVDATEETDPPGEEPGPPPCPTEALWKVVNDDPTDFKSWTLLIKTAEETGQLDKIRKVYEEFLAEFPLCYGYWKKYSDQEKNVGNDEEAVAIFERGVAAIPLSVDLWKHFCAYSQDRTTDDEAIRSLFERAVAAAGKDFLAHPLWDKYLAFEETRGTPRQVAALYCRILQLPIQKLENYWDRFKAYVGSVAARSILNPEEVAAADAKEEVRRAAALEEAQQARAAAKLAKQEAESKRKAELAAAMEEGEVPDPVPDEETTTEDEEPLQIPPEDEQGLREKFIQDREPAYKGAAEQLKEIGGFEAAIKRPYFHFQKLKPEELRNWSAYLDHAQAAFGDPAAVAFLFERCLVACANYHTYWTRYADYMEAQEGPEAAREVLRRASGVFVKRRPEVHLHAAMFETLHGHAAAARAAYDRAGALAPGLLQVLVRRANLERREGRPDAARALYTSAIEACPADPATLAFLHMSYARFLHQGLGDVAGARAVLEQGLDAAPGSAALWEAAVELELQCPDDGRAARALSLLRRATAAPRTDASSPSTGPASEQSPAAEGRQTDGVPASTLENGSGDDGWVVVSASEAKRAVDGNGKVVGQLAPGEREDLANYAVEVADLCGALPDLAEFTRAYAAAFPREAVAEAAEEGASSSRKRAAAWEPAEEGASKAPRPEAAPAAPAPPAPAAPPPGPAPPPAAPAPPAAPPPASTAPAQPAAQPPAPAQPYAQDPNAAAHAAYAQYAQQYAQWQQQQAMYQPQGYAAYQQPYGYGAYPQAYGQYPQQ